MVRFLSTTFETLEILSEPPLSPEEEVLPTIQVLEAMFTLMMFPYAELHAQRSFPRELAGEEDDLSSVEVEQPFA
jgi:hypothetical protein